MFRRSLNSVAALGLLIASILLGACNERAEDPELEFHRGENALAEDRADWARLHFQSQLVRTPAHQQAARALGLSWHSGDQQSLSTAIDAYQHYLNQWGNDDELRARLVLALNLLGRQSESRSWCQTPTQDFAVLQGCFEAMLALADPKAEDFLKHMQALAPERAETDEMAARWHDTQGDFAAALAAADRSLARDPICAELHYLRARILRRQSDPSADAAFARYQAARLLELGKAEPSERLQALRALAVDTASEQIDWLRIETPLLLQTGHLSDARKRITALIDHAESTDDDLARIAVLANQAGLTDQAQSLFALALQRNPEHRGARASLVLIALDQDQPAQARDLLDPGLKHAPNFARFQLLAARLARATNARQEAETAWQRAIDLAPWAVDWRLEFASYLLDERRAAEATALLKNAPERTPAIDAFLLQHNLSIESR